jgi:hypothetical protein
MFVEGTHYKVNARTGCWEWTRAKDTSGYGVVSVEKRQRQAPRVALAAKLGRELAQGECALHTCDRPGCVNPAHLWAGTVRDNVLDAIRKGRWTAPSKRRRMTPADILKIQKLRKTGMTKMAIAAAVGFSRRSVSVALQKGRPA